MKFRQYLLTLGIILCAPFSTFLAYMVAAQHGTLSLVDNAVYMVLSLPVSAFNEVDLDLDGMLSVQELEQYRTKFIHQRSTAPSRLARQLVVMGRFVLSNKDRPLDFKAQLFGSEPEDMLLRITASRKHDKAKQQKIDTPEEPVHSFYLR